jgi:hypothetical protein
MTGKVPDVTLIADTSMLPNSALSADLPLWLYNFTLRIFLII